jgi:hypothetical protein
MKMTTANKKTLTLTDSPTETINKLLTICNQGSLHSSVGIATGYGLDNPSIRSSSPGRIKNFLSLRRPDRLWGPTSLVSNGYRGLFPRGKVAGA